MKKIMLVAALVVGVSMVARAGIFNLGVKAGLEIPDVSLKNPTADLKDIHKNYTGFHAGGMLLVKVPIIGIGVQPELLYVYRQMPTQDKQGVTNTTGASFIEVPVNLTWGLDLLVVRPFVVASPYLSYAFTDLKVLKSDMENTQLPGSVGQLESINKVNYGIGLGIGAELFKFQVMAKYNFGLTNLSENISTIQYKQSGFTLSLGYFF